MRKKLFTLFLSLVASVGTIFAASGTCGKNLTWDLTDGVLTISGSGDMTNWSWDPPAPWYSYREDITSVIISNSVTSIGDIAFFGCYHLTSVTIPNSVNSIGAWAFAYCFGLTSVTVPNSVTSIGQYAFAGCSGLTSIVVENGNTVYDNRDNCNAIIETSTNTLIVGCKNTIIPNSVTSIGESAFYSCEGLTSVTIPNSVTSIGDEAFAFCTSLTSITCEAVNPPVCMANVYLSVDVFLDVDKSIPLYVPAGSIAAYQEAAGWEEFTNIQAIEGTVEPEDSVYDVVYLDQAGLQIEIESITLHLPDAPVIEGFTFLKWQVVAGDLEDGIYIQAVYEPNNPSSAPEMVANPANSAQKLIRDGNVYILTEGKTFTLRGQEVR